MKCKANLISGFSFQSFNSLCLVRVLKQNFSFSTAETMSSDELEDFEVCNDYANEEEEYEAEVAMDEYPQRMIQNRDQPAVELMYCVICNRDVEGLPVEHMARYHDVSW